MSHHPHIVDANGKRLSDWTREQKAARNAKNKAARAARRNNR